MANQIYDPENDEKRRQGNDGALDELAHNTDEDNLQAQMSPRDQQSFKRKLAEEGMREALRAAESGLFGERVQPMAKKAREGFEKLTPEQLQNIENQVLHNPNLRKPGWYINQAKSGVKNTAKDAGKSFLRRNSFAIGITLLVNLFVGGLLLFLFLLAPFKDAHFQTILRSANFARFQLLVRQQFSRVIFESSVLTQDSVGTFKNSLLVKQIRQAVPDRQLAQLGRSGKVQFDFYPNGSFGDAVVPFRESLKGVVVDGKKYYIDDFAQSSFGKNYHDLSVRERWGVENAFLKAVNAELGDLMALMPRYVRWNPSVRFQQRAGIQLVRWLNGAREYLGKTPKEAKALSAKEISERVMEPGVSKTRSGLADINEGADENRKELLDAKTAGEPAPLPGETRSKIASRARFARGASDAVFATTTYCIGREIIRLFTPEYQAEREAQAARMAGYGMSGTDQIKSGAQATNKEATLVANSEWDGEGEVPDAVNSVMYSRTVGDQVPKNPAYAQQIPWLNPALALGDWYPAFEQYNKIAGPLMMAGPLGGILEQLGIDIGTRELNDKVCNAIMNEYVQYGIAGVEVIVAVVSLGSTKGVTAAVKAGLELVFHAAVGYGLDRLQSMLIEWTVKEYANLYFTGLEQGADRFNTAYVAQSSIAQNGIRNVTYGRPMDLNEANQSQAVAMAELRAEYQKKPIMERYFAIDNPFSLTGLTVAKLPVSPSGVMNTTQNGAHIIGSILSSPFRLLGTIGNAIFPSKSAHAEGVAFDKSTYGVTQWGWSQAELDRIKNDSSFSLASMIGKVEPRLTELNERYAKCYDSNTFRLQIEEPKDATGKGICTKEFLSTDDALYWRYYNAMMFSASHLSGSV